MSDSSDDEFSTDSASQPVEELEAGISFTAEPIPSVAEQNRKRSPPAIFGVLGCAAFYVLFQIVRASMRHASELLPPEPEPAPLRFDAEKHERDMQKIRAKVRAAVPPDVRAQIEAEEAATKSRKKATEPAQ